MTRVAGDIKRHILGLRVAAEHVRLDEKLIHIVLVVEIECFSEAMIIKDTVAIADEGRVDTSGGATHNRTQHFYAAVH